MAKLFQRMTPGRWVLLAAIIGLNVVAQFYDAPWARVGAALLILTGVGLNVRNGWHSMR